MSEFTKPQLNIIRAYLAQVRERAKIKKEEQVITDPPISLYLKWVCLASFAANDIQTAIWWYRYRHKPNSKESRPVVILRALLRASERDYVEPTEPIEPNPAILRATPIQKKRARMMFIREFGFETFREKVGPIMRRHGVKALFETPATSEIREYVAILSKVSV